MPATDGISGERPRPDYDKASGLSPVKHLPPQTPNSNPINISRPQSRLGSATTRVLRQDIQDFKSNERELRKPQNDNSNPTGNALLHPEDRSATTMAHPTTGDPQDLKEQESSKRQNDPDLQSTTARQRTSAADHHDGSYEAVENEHAAARGHGAPREREQSSVQTSRKRTISSPFKPRRSSAQATSTRSSKHLPGVAEGTSRRYHYARIKPTYDRVPPSHYSEDEVERRLDIIQSSRGLSYAGQGFMGAIRMLAPSPSLPSPTRQDRYNLLKEEYNRIKDELKTRHAAVEDYERELKRTQAELRDRNHYVDQLQQENQRSKDSMNGLQNELNNVHQELEDAKNLSEVRGKELFGAQVFLTKADTLSISEVGEKVTALNEEIFQAAATLGEALMHQRYDVSQAEFDAAAAESVQMVGEKITNLLITDSRKPEPEVNPFIVQVVLQIFMVKFCVSKIQSWYPLAGDSTIGGFLTAIYSEIHSTEEQAVSGRWRALTRAHTRPTTETWYKELFQSLLSVLTVAAWMSSSSEHLESFGRRLPPIFKAVNELRTAIGENFTSADLDILVFDCDDTYDPSMMDDAYSDGRQPSSKRVSDTIVGTAGIGLKKLMVGHSSSKDAPQFQSVLPAKIVLKSTLNEALEPVKTSRPRKTKNLKKAIVPVSMDVAHTEESRGSSKVGDMDVTQG